MVSFFKHGNEPMVSVKEVGYFLKICQIFNKYPAA